MYMSKFVNSWIFSFFILPVEGHRWRQSRPNCKACNANSPPLSFTWFAPVSLSAPLAVVTLFKYTLYLLLLLKRVHVFQQLLLFTAALWNVMKLVDQNWFNLKKSFKEDGIVVQLDTKWAFLVICFLLQWTRIERVKPMKGKTDYLAQGKRLKNPYKRLPLCAAVVAAYTEHGGLSLPS